MAPPGLADSRLGLLYSGSVCGPRPTPEPDEYFRSRFDAGEVNLWTVSVCTRCDRRHFLNRFRFTALLRREVQKAKE
jgi:hypothetical protein